MSTEHRIQHSKSRYTAASIIVTVATATVTSMLQQAVQQPALQ